MCMNSALSGEATKQTPMETVTIQIEIPTAQYKLLETLAAQRRSSINDLIVSILSEWVEREARLQEGRKLMLELGKA